MKKASITSKRTEKQETQFRRMAEDSARSGVELALKKVNPDKDGLQRLLENGDEIKSAIVDLLIAKAQKLTVTNQFAKEEVKSSYGYLSGYKPKGITAQTNRLRELFPGIGYADEKLAERPLPPNAEGWFAIPRWEKIASTYNEAVQKVFDLIKKTRDGKFYNYRENEIGLDRLRQSDRKKNVVQKIGDEQKDYDILIIPAQFGFLHRGRSVRRALEVMNAYQFGLGAYEIGIMLLTHPERLQNFDDLWIDCAGDEYRPDDTTEFCDAPYFEFDDGRVEFDAGGIGRFNDGCGSASGFLLECAEA